MSRMTLRGIDQEATDKIIKKPKKKALPSNSLKTLAGGWSPKEADDFSNL